MFRVRGGEALLCKARPNWRCRKGFLVNVEDSAAFTWRYVRIGQEFEGWCFLFLFFILGLCFGYLRVEVPKFADRV